MVSIAELQEVLDAAWAGFEYMTDQDRLGVSEYWEDLGIGTLGVKRGDCEDFALMCRTALKAKGIPSRLVYCITDDNERHLVCEVEGYILNNMSRRVRFRDNLPWTWVAMSGYNSGEPWHLIA